MFVLFHSVVGRIVTTPAVNRSGSRRSALGSRLLKSRALGGGLTTLNEGALAALGPFVWAPVGAHATMLRQAAGRLLKQGMRALSTSTRQLEEAAAPAGPKEFLEAWAKSAPAMLAVPELPTNFMPPEAKTPEAAGVDGERFPVNFYTPNGVIAQDKFDQVVLPGVEGVFGLKATHVPIIAQLNPGVVELHDGTEVSKYFISGGFAFMHPNSVADIVTLEAAPLDHFDSTSVKTALQAAVNAQGTDDYENAVNRAASELFGALDAAMEAKS